jgi:hypothetical protein
MRPPSTTSAAPVTKLRPGCREGDLRNTAGAVPAASTGALDRAVEVFWEQGYEDASPAAVAVFDVTVLEGLSHHGRDGAPQERLDSIVDSAMAAWPALAAPDR